ncbi:DUF4153 domain-containing protein [Maricaulis sp.]|uniref:DUF4153 domain-containing protein n=1 Tax=Maricaulis sp. TaxID=1486257 RepID=UPI003A8F7A2D
MNQGETGEIGKADTGPEPIGAAGAAAADSALLDRWDLALLALVGGLSGYGFYSLVQNSEAPDPRLVLALSICLIAGAASFSVAWARRAMAARLALTLCLTALTGIVTWLISGSNAEQTGLAQEQTVGFWLFPSLPLIMFLGLVLGLVSIGQGRARWPYPDIFRAGLNLPIQWGFGLAASGLLTGFVFLWALALSAAGWDGLKQAFEDGWLAWPLAGAIAGLAIGLARSVNKLREAAEAIILIAAKLALPILAVFSVVFAAVILVGGIDNLQAAGSPTAILLALAILAKLIFNAVYRDGSETPGRIMRSFAWIALATLPVYATLAVYGISLRVTEYGFSPSRVIVLIVAALVAAYTLLLLLSLAGDILRPARQGWMPLVSRLNTGFAGLWFVLLLALQSPLLSPNRISANDQVARLMDGRTEAEQFDFIALRFTMGAPGRRAIGELAEISDHPQADYIRSHAIEMRDRTERWTGQTPQIPAAALPAYWIERIDALQSIGANEALALLEAAIARRDAAQALLCEIYASETLSAPEKDAAALELQQRVSHFMPAAYNIANRYPELAENPAVRAAAGHWVPERDACN